MLIHGKQVELLPCNEATAPLVLLNTFGSEGRAVYEQCRALSAPAFHMAAVSGLTWDDDLSPWALPPIAENGAPYAGNAPAYLKLLTGEILPYALEVIGGKPQYIAVAGYSLGGLFAVYSLYNTDVFSAAVSASGSFWFPDFLAYAAHRPMIEKADCIYLSLGDREKYTANPYLKTVQDNTQTLYEQYRAQGLKVTFELNKGNHFKQSTLRLAKGIKWMLENKKNV